MSEFLPSSTVNPFRLVWWLRNPNIATVRKKKFFVVAAPAVTAAAAIIDDPAEGVRTVLLLVEVSVGDEAVRATIVSMSRRTTAQTAIVPAMSRRARPPATKGDLLAVQVVSKQLR